MSITDQLSLISPNYFASTMLGFGAVFTSLWYLDHKTHLEIWKKDITDGELRTHRMILYSSYGLLFSLVLMAWFPWQSLPLFIGCWVTRTLHEGMDELIWHLPRCSERETLLHLGMWITIHGGTAVTFMWGFFLRYQGLSEVPLPIQILLGIVVIFMTVIGQKELNSYPKSKKLVRSQKETTAS